MKKVTLTLALFAAGFSPVFSQNQPAAAAKVMEQPPRPMMPNSGPETQLTPDQEKKARELRMLMMKENLPVKNEVTEKKAKLKTLRSAEKVDMVTIDKLIEEIFTLRAGLEKKKEVMMQEFRKILNDEQRVYFDNDRRKFIPEADDDGFDSDSRLGGRPMPQPPRPNQQPPAPKPTLPTENK